MSTQPPAGQMPNEHHHKAMETGGKSTPQPTGHEDPQAMAAKMKGLKHAHAGRTKRRPG